MSLTLGIMQVGLSVLAGRWLKGNLYVQCLKKEAVVHTLGHAFTWLILQSMRRYVWIHRMKTSIHYKPWIKLSAVFCTSASAATNSRACNGSKSSSAECRHTWAMHCNISHVNAWPTLWTTASFFKHCTYKLPLSQRPARTLGPTCRIPNVKLIKFQVALWVSMSASSWSSLAANFCMSASAATKSRNWNGSKSSRYAMFARDIAWSDSQTCQGSA